MPIAIFLPARLPSLLSGPNPVTALSPVRDSIAVAGGDVVRLYNWATVAAQQVTYRMTQQARARRTTPQMTQQSPEQGATGTANRKRRRAAPTSMSHPPCDVLMRSAGVSAMCTVISI